MIKIFYIKYRESCIYTASTYIHFSKMITLSSSPLVGPRKRQESLHQEVVDPPEIWVRVRPTINVAINRVLALTVAKSIVTIIIMIIVVVIVPFSGEETVRNMMMMTCRDAARSRRGKNKLRLIVAAAERRDVEPGEAVGRRPRHRHRRDRRDRAARGGFVEMHGFQ